MKRFAISAKTWKLSSWDASSRYPDFTLLINGEQYYWEHWGMVDNYSYRQSIAKRIRWYREHGYSDYLIQDMGRGGERLERAGFCRVVQVEETQTQEK